MKRDGRREDFIFEKLAVSMVKSGHLADLTHETAKNVETKVHEGTSTKEIKRIVLRELRKKNPEWEKNWLVYDRAVEERVEWIV